jgi:hypothetical protein
MSVNFHVHHFAASIVSALRIDPRLTTFLCDLALDYEPTRYAEEMLRGVPENRIDAARAYTTKRGDRVAAAQKELLASLEAAGIAREKLGVGLHLEKSWWGMEQMIGGDLGKLLISGEAGESIGDDVGYGPARLLSPTELGKIAAALDPLTREACEQRFRAHVRAKASIQSTDEEFEMWSWKPFCELRVYVREAADAGAWILRWYD